MTCTQPTDTAATMYAIEYAKRRLDAFFRGRPTDELEDAEKAYRVIHAAEDNATALGLAEYIRGLIREREAVVQ